MRTLGTPSASAVASAMALASLGSEPSASFIQSWEQRERIGAGGNAAISTAV